MKAVTGFTLTELVIAVAIVGILAAIAYPSYMSYVQRARRADAKATLMELAQQLERNYTVTLRYDQDSAGKTIDNAYLSQQWLNGQTVLNYYNFSIDFPNPPAFLLTASPTGAQASDQCGNLTLDNTGKKGTNSSLPVAQCW
jgi:type IV pilus assembly protein PilE